MNYQPSPRILLLSAVIGCSGSSSTTDSGDAATWMGDVTAETITVDVGWGTLSSSSRVEVTWAEAEAAAFAVSASHGAHQVVSLVDASETSAIVHGLRSDTTYTVTVQRCEDVECTTTEAAPSVEATTAAMVFEVAGEGPGFDAADNIIENSDTKGYGLYYGADAPAEVQGTVQLYYDSNTAGEKGVNFAWASTMPEDVTEPAVFEQLEGFGLYRSDTGDGLAKGPQTHQAVPLASGSVRLFFEAVLYGDDGRNGRLFSIDSQDGYLGRDFNPGTSTQCQPEALSVDGECQPEMIIGHEDDGQTGIKEIRQSKLLYPMFDSWLWDESEGSVIICTVHFSPSAETCTETFFNMGLSVYDGTAWSLQYDESGCPQVLPGVQAPMPVHMGDGRYMIVFSANEAAEMKMETNKVLRVFYVDAAVSGEADQIEWADFEDVANAREVTTVWLDGTELTEEEEQRFDDYGIYSPTGNPEQLVMYSNMSCGEGAEACGSFIGQAGWVNP